MSWFVSMSIKPLGAFAQAASTIFFDSAKKILDQLVLGYALDFQNFNETGHQARFRCFGRANI